MQEMVSGEKDSVGWQSWRRVRDREILGMSSRLAKAVTLDGGSWLKVWLVRFVRRVVRGDLKGPDTRSTVCRDLVRLVAFKLPRAVYTSLNLSLLTYWSCTLSPRKV